MKKIIYSILLSIFFILIDVIVVNNKKKEEIPKFIYISYLEYERNFMNNTLSINKVLIDKMIDNIKLYKFNAIILHVSPFSDAIYKSQIFPFSRTISGKEGGNPGMDYLEYFIKKAHQKNIKVHAWINPYRISSKNDFNNLDKDNPAKKLNNTEYISISEKGIYYNPTKEYVKQLIFNQIKELVENYKIDGIHFDDYFYIDYEIDKLEYSNYQEKGGNLSLKEFRYNHINDLIKRISNYLRNKKIIFSIAPDGNINNNYNYHYADIKTWIKNEYIDYLMPQLYYGFENKYAPFIDTYIKWKELVGNKNIKLIPVLAFYKVGEMDNNSTSKSEWLKEGIINNQINYLNKQSNYYGYALFRYDYLFNKSLLNNISKNELKLLHQNNCQF